MVIDIKVLISTVITMFIIVIAGFVARRLGWIDADFSKKLSGLVLKFLQPFLIIKSVLGIEYSNENLKSGMVVLLVSVIAMGGSALAAIPMTAWIKDKNEHRLTEFCFIFSNCAFLGFPLLEVVYGSIGVFWGAFYVITFNVMCWTYGMVVLSKANPEIKINFKKMLLNYGTVPCAVSLLLYVLRIKLPDTVMTASSYLGSMCTPVSMLLIGAQLTQIPFKKMFINLKVYYYCIMKQIVLPLAVAAVLMLLRFSADMVALGALMTALPAASNCVMFAESYDMDSSFGAHVVGISTLLSTATIPFVMYLIRLMIGA